MDVVLVRWPAEDDRRADLEAAGKPRLLLVENGVDPPSPSGDCLEDWVRIPAGEQDVAARVAGLQSRAGHHRTAVPIIDVDGVLHFGRSWVSLPPVELRLTEPLVERFGAVVGREAITKAGWPSSAPHRNALDVHMLRLRRRLAPLGLSVRTIRSRGYLLEASESRHEQVANA